MIYKHSGALGDVLYSIPCVLDLERRHGDGKVKFYLQPGVKADSHAGQAHPSGDFRMSEGMALSLKPLLKAQGFEVGLWEAQPVDVDLDWFRHLPIDYASGNIPTWYTWTFQAAPDLAHPWLSVEPDPRYAGRLVVNRTSRYRNPGISYAFLDEYQPVFVGLEAEYESFKRECPTATWAQTDNLLEVTQVIAGGACFVGGQSAAFAVAEGLKVRRLLEVCPKVNNVQPCGGVANSFVTQAGFQWLVEEFLKGKTLR